MNNARYTREADFSRIGLLLESGLWAARTERRKSKDPTTNFLLGAIQAQYRQSLRMGDRFSFTARIAGWDERAFYLEQWMTKDTDGQVAFSAICQLIVTPRSVSPEMLVEDLGHKSIASPVLSPTLQIFKQNSRLSFSSSQVKA